MSRHMKNIVKHTVSLAMISSVFVAAFFLPNFFIYLNRSSQAVAQKNVPTSFKLGLENLTSEYLKNFFLPDGKKCAVALITNQTGKDQQGNRNIDILLSKGINIRYIFTPKHGFYADRKESLIEKSQDAATKLPMLSWRDCLREGSNCNAYVKSVDVLLFDMQDSGVRYGYVTTLLEIMEAAKKYNKKIVVLDRPNLLGNSIEGAVAQVTLQNKSLNAALPIRYGMTIGELAHYFNKFVVKSPLSLCVIPMAHYQRENNYSRSLFLTSLSPNIQSIDSCHCYSFLGLLGEIAPFDVGLGTDKAFRCLALPEKSTISRSKWYELRQVLKEHGVESKVCRYYSPRKKTYCTGLTLCIKDINSFSSCATVLSVVSFFKKEKVPLILSRSFDALVGTQSVRKFLEGTLVQSDLETEISAGLRGFFHKAVSACMYSPLPRVMNF